MTTPNRPKWGQTMRVETYYPNGNLKEVWDCLGPYADPDEPCIEESGRCNGCDGEYNEEHLQCYQAGKRLWFKDPAEIGPIYTLEDFLKEAEP